MDVKVTHEPRQTRVRVVGEPSEGQLSSLMQVLAQDSVDWPTEAVMFDLSEIANALGAEEQQRLRADVERWLPRMKLVTFRWRGAPD